MQLRDLEIWKIFSTIERSWALTMKTEGLTSSGIFNSVSMKWMYIFYTVPPSYRWIQKHCSTYCTVSSYVRAFLFIKINHQLLESGLQPSEITPTRPWVFPVFQHHFSPLSIYLFSGIWFIYLFFSRQLIRIWPI